MKRLTIILLFFASVLQGQTGAGYWYGSTEPGTITPEPDTLTLTYWDDFILLHIQNTGITETGSGVSEWQDRSGNGNHSTQTVDANRPMIDGSGNVVFDGVDNYLSMTDIWASVNDSAFTVFVVSEISETPTGDASTARYFSYNKETSGVYISIKYDDQTGTDFDALGFVYDGVTVQDSLTQVAQNSTNLVVLAASESTTVEGRINGVQKYTYTTDGSWAGISAPEGQVLGASRGANNAFFNGKIYFIGIANRKFTPAEIATTESELNSFFTIY